MSRSVGPMRPSFEPQRTALPLRVLHSRVDLIVEQGSEGTLQRATHGLVVVAVIRPVDWDPSWPQRWKSHQVAETPTAHSYSPVTCAIIVLASTFLNSTCATKT